MRNFLTIILILNSVQVFSQKRLTLIIDTIDFVDYFDQIDFKVTLTNQGFAELGEMVDDAKITTDIFPNFQTTVYLKSDSTTIQIPIDIQNGYVELSNIYKHDTVRINRLKIYSNCYRDTIKSTIEYYRVTKGSLADKPYKVKFKVRTKKGKCKRKPPYKTMYVVNNKRYFVSIQKTESNLTTYTSGQGYKPRKTKKNYEESEPYTGTLLGVSSWTYEYINKVTLRLK